MILNIITYIIILAALAYTFKNFYLMFFGKKSKCAACAAGNLCKLKKL